MLRRNVFGTDAQVADVAQFEEKRVTFWVVIGLRSVCIRDHRMACITATVAGAMINAGNRFATRIVRSSKSCNPIPRMRTPPADVSAATISGVNPPATADAASDSDPWYSRIV